MNRTLCLLALLLINSPASGQLVHTELDAIKPLIAAADGSHEYSAVALVTLTSGASGSCVVVDKYKKLDDGWLGLAVTANHVVKGESGIKVKYISGRGSAQCSLAAANDTVDLAIIHAWIPDEIPSVNVAHLTGGHVTLVGYPAGIRDTLSGGYLRSNSGNIYMDILVRPGFSGGGVFRDGALIGCISGGWFWTKDENDRQATWPTRAADGKSILSLLSGIKRY